MHKNTEAMVIINDLDSMTYRIEALQAHPRYTDAQNAIKLAKQAMIDGSSELHQTEMRERFARQDAQR